MLCGRRRDFCRVGCLPNKGGTKRKKKIQEKKNIIINQQQKHKPKVKAKSKSKQNKISFISFLWVHRFFVCMATKHTRTHTFGNSYQHMDRKVASLTNQLLCQGSSVGAFVAWVDAQTLQTPNMRGTAPMPPSLLLQFWHFRSPLPPRKHIQTHCGNNY